MNFLEVFLVAALATYRLTLIGHEEIGPGHIFERMRTRLGVKYDEYSKRMATNWVAEGVLCFFCLSVWIAFIVTAILAFAAWFGHVEIGVLLLFPFALSGAAVYLRKAVG